MRPLRLIVALTLARLPVSEHEPSMGLIFVVCSSPGEAHLIPGFARQEVGVSYSYITLTLAMWCGFSR
jgi:hypothetical protein